MDYEWDDAKAAANLAKHGIDFLDAIGALIDWRRMEDVDQRFAYGEERTRTLGMARGEDTTRIISARRATRHEQDRYYAAAP